MWNYPLKEGSRKKEASSSDIWEMLRLLLLTFDRIWRIMWLLKMWLWLKMFLHKNRKLMRSILDFPATLTSTNKDLQKQSLLPAVLPVTNNKTHWPINKYIWWPNHHCHSTRYSWLAKTYKTTFRIFTYSTLETCLEENCTWAVISHLVWHIQPVIYVARPSLFHLSHYSIA